MGNLDNLGSLCRGYVNSRGIGRRIPDLQLKYSRGEIILEPRSGSVEYRKMCKAWCLVLETVGILTLRAYELNFLLWGFLFLNMPFILEFFAILNVFFIWKSCRGESL